MTIRPFDILLLIVGLAFVIQSIQTPDEQYDLFGPALWPLSIAIGLVALILLNAFMGRTSSNDKKPKLTSNLLLTCLLTFMFIGLQTIAISPFYLSAAIYCFCIYFLLARPVSKPWSLAVVAISALIFCFAIQTIFTSLINLDLTTTFSS